MRTLTSFVLPKVHGRLRLPVVDTVKKQLSEDMQRTPLESFIQNVCHIIPGEKILFATFYDKFIESLDPEERYHWSKIKVSRSMPSDTPVGASTENKRYVGNISLEPKPQADSARAYICINNRLRYREE